jgi:hypothetical protein
VTGISPFRCIDIESLMCDDARNVSNRIVTRNHDAHKCAPRSAMRQRMGVCGMYSDNRIRVEWIRGCLIKSQLFISRCR